ncbi:MAG: bifunctional diaminohydroxyphosphoribosylaminopyrimidine deaminase/5-amino-6-(5-phosphoribosylamino)uracil reductase RibD [Candidatus Electrothrix sp. GW3-4]|uniref:bifunctional diaminohydroxyphosphoribosylaminopyrimidine deaminase/5-amino-6-(5-phosphoribosylamino)uracil reductase RibD n=1 Tax=Candidatus Electrothrix sp. GW3-4 TaxID=3126740 RepID=UPI0030D52904
MSSDSAYMRLALKEAEKGLGRTAPNPCVGAVIVRDDQIIGLGHHRRAGSPHAEVNAIADALGKGKSCQGATIYVTLEPCNHTGKTPLYSGYPHRRAQSGGHRDGRFQSCCLRRC